MKTLDYETTQAYVLEIQAKDGGDVPKVATSTVSVAVSGVNDNEPSCTPMPSISVLESASIGLRHTLVLFHNLMFSLRLYNLVMSLPGMWCQCFQLLNIYSRQRASHS
jgi:hypothetical protein